MGKQNTTKPETLDIPSFLRRNGKTPAGLTQDWIGFVNEMLGLASEGMSLDGGQIQEIAQRYGLVEVKIVYEPCCDLCACAEVGDFPQHCYRKTYT